MGMIPDQDREFLKTRFSDELQDNVTIVAYTRKAQGMDQEGLECEFCVETEQLISELTELSDKISVDVRELSSDDAMASDLGVDKLPALIVRNSTGTGVRYFGIPGGFEFSSLIEDIVDISRNATDLTEDVKVKVRSLDHDVHIQVFVTPTCPYCPSAVRAAHQMAIENPSRIKADAIEAAEFPHLVSKYDISAVPTIVINDEVQIEGALPEEEFAAQVIGSTEA